MDLVRATGIETVSQVICGDRTGCTLTGRERVGPIARQRCKWHSEWREIRPNSSFSCSGQTVLVRWGTGGRRGLKWGRVVRGIHHICVRIICDENYFFSVEYVLKSYYLVIEALIWLMSPSPYPSSPQTPMTGESFYNRPIIFNSFVGHRWVARLNGQVGYLWCSTSVGVRRDRTTENCVACARFKTLWSIRHLQSIKCDGSSLLLVFMEINFSTTIVCVCCTSVLTGRGTICTEWPARSRICSWISMVRKQVPPNNTLSV